MCNSGISWWQWFSPQELVLKKRGFLFPRVTIRWTPHIPNGRDPRNGTRTCCTNTWQLLSFLVGVAHIWLGPIWFIFHPHRVTCNKKQLEVKNINPYLNASPAVWALDKFDYNRCLAHCYILHIQHEQYISSKIQLFYAQLLLSEIWWGPMQGAGWVKLLWAV